MPKPVEIEFLMRDKLSGGLDAAGKSAEALGDRVERVSQSITERIAAQREQVRYVEQCLKDLRRQYDRLGPGKAQTEMRAEIEACTRALEEDKAVLNGLRSEHEKNSATARGLTMELRQLQGAMAKMRLEGRQNSQEYQTMAQRAALLQDTLGDLRTQTKILSHDNAGLQGLISGASGVAGAFTMATGIMGAFASENENLVKIQTRVQSVLAITMGLQQVMNALNKDSAFRLVTVVKMKNLLTAANTRLAASLGISTAAASALMATLTLGLSAVITGLIVLWDRYSDSQEAAAAKAKERVEIEKEGRAQMIKTRFEIDSTLKSLKEFNGTKEQEKAKVEELNRKYGESFGYYNTIAEWYDVLLQKGEAYIQMLFLQAKVQALINKATEADEQVNTLQSTPADKVKGATGGFGRWMAKVGGAQMGMLPSDMDREVDKSNEEVKARLVQAAREQRDAYLDEAKSLVDEIANIGQEFNIGGFIAPPKDGSGDVSKLTQNLVDYETKARRRIEDTRISLMKEGFEKERAEAQNAFEQEKARIAQEEQERLQLYERLRKAGGKVTPGQKSTILAQAAAQRVQAARKLDHTLAEIDKKEEKADADHLENLLKTYKDYAAEREDVERKHDKAIAALRSHLSDERLAALGKQMTDRFVGNVDLLARPMIDAARLAEKGWQDAGEGIATVFSSQFGIDDVAGKRREILITPILPNGDVLSEEELNAYIDESLNGAEDILKADTLGLVIAVDVDPDGTAGEALHLLQEKYYALKQDTEGNAASDARIRRALKVAEDTKNRELADLSGLLAKYRDFEAQRAEIRRQGNEDIAALEEQRTEANSEQIDRAIAVARQKIEEGIRSVNDAEAANISKDNGFLKQLFGDYSSLSFDKLRELIAQAKELQAYLNGKGSAEGITFISAADLKNIEKSPAELDKLRKALDKLLQTGKKGGTNKWENIFKTFEKGLAELKGANGIKDISGAIGTIGGAAADAAGELAAMFDQMGDTQTADAISGVQQVMSAVSNIGQGFAKGGIVGGIGAAIGEAANFIGQAFAAEARHREALKEIERAKLDFQRQYNLALLEQNLLLEEATNVFGERQIMKAANAMQVYKDALSQFEAEMKGSAPTMNWFERITGDALGTYAARMAQYKEGIYGLASAQIVTGHKKTGLFGWGKGKDLYSSILSVYPELIDANGELDTAMLQTILDTRKMSDETRKYLENLIELKDAMDEAEQALEDYLSSTFGSLGDSVLDRVRDMAKGVTGVYGDMCDDISSKLEELAEQVVYSLFFADKFDKLQDDLKSIYASGKSEEDIAYDVMDLLDDFYSGIGSNMDAAQSWMDEFAKRAEQMGYELWKPDSTTQSGKAGAFTTMTQDQGTKLEGLMTSLQMHGASVDDKMDDIAEGLGSSLDALNRIAKNTDTLPQILALWQAIKRDGLKAK
ncbi:hypothetical protein [Alistipes ihumii]|jgi:hypothetical protein|uniref:hypothetical protein n=1 Tax=Alistipes ihumii TaxID=1470347 RepID=UPI00266CD8E1|nr:hypothetical protein [Alistipes ihumii]